MALINRIIGMVRKRASAPLTFAWDNLTQMTTNGSNALTSTGTAARATSNITDSDDMTIAAVIASGVDVEFGLTTQSAVSVPFYNDMDYSIYVSRGWGRLAIVESNTVRVQPNVGAVFSNGDTMSIVRSGNTITYKLNGSTIYTSGVSASGKTLRAGAAASASGGMLTSVTWTP